MLLLVVGLVLDALTRKAALRPQNEDEGEIEDEIEDE